jgi:hypothetical protein
LVRFILALTIAKPEHFRNQGKAVSLTASTPASTETRDEATLNDAKTLLYGQHAPYLERIGIDATMKRMIVENGEIQHELRVGEECFITEKVLCDWKAEGGPSRATRVWVVYRKGGSCKEKFVLKDVWLKEGTEVEGDKLKELETLVNNHKHDHAQLVNWHRDHFLHMHAHQKLDQTVPGVTDVHNHITLISDDFAPTSKSGTTHTGSQRTERNPSRFHYRNVFKDEMIPLELVPCRKSASQVVIGIFRGPSTLYCHAIHSQVPLCSVLGLVALQKDTSRY